MKALALGLATLVGIMAASDGRAQDEAARAELAPGGTMRMALVEAPNAGVFFVGRGPDGAPRGVTADLGRELAGALGVPVEFTVFPNSGEATEATRTGAVEVSFMPVDDARRQVVEFGPAYYLLESTYLVTGASGAADVAEVDRPGMRVIAIANTTTFRASARTLKATQPLAVTSVADAIEMMRSGRADAFALSRDTLRPIQPLVPGSRIVSGGFQRTSISIAVPKDKPAALAFATAWLERAKSSGLVRRIFDAHGLGEEAVAP